MSDDVTALGAWCDVCPAGHAQASPGSVSFNVHEFAVLASGRRITLHAERGFGISGPDRPTVGDPLAGLTGDQIERDVRTTVLPDDEGTVDDHPYGWLSALLLRQGVVATAQSLRAVPYTVEFSDHLRRLLSQQGEPGSHH